MKILVVGLGCSGKSTLARKIGEQTQLPVYHLDRYLWKPDWIRTPDHEFKEIQKQILAKDKWVYEGFNPATLLMQIKAADQIVYLYKSHLHISYNWLKRLWKYRKISRSDMADGNIEHFSYNYLKWLWKYDNKKILEDITHSAKNKNVTVIKNNRDVNNFISILKKQI